jgi:hypothetical protein
MRFSTEHKRISDNMGQNELQALSLKNEINANHRECLKTANDAVDYAIKAGELLMQVKDLLHHGEFQKWIDQYCDFSYDVASGYMRLHKRLLTYSKVERAQLLTDATSVANLANLIKPAETTISTPRLTVSSSPPSGTADVQRFEPSSWTEPDGTVVVETSPTITTTLDTPARNCKTPKLEKQYDRSYWYMQWNASIGPLCRLVDKIGNNVGEMHGARHKGVHKALETATQNMIEWMGVKR